VLATENNYTLQAQVLQSFGRQAAILKFVVQQKEIFLPVSLYNGSYVTSTELRHTLIRALR
jgi:hypothetical protein